MMKRNSFSLVRRSSVEDAMTILGSAMPTTAAVTISVPDAEKTRGGFMPRMRAQSLTQRTSSGRSGNCPSANFDPGRGQGDRAHIVEVGFDQIGIEPAGNAGLERRIQLGGQIPDPRDVESLPTVHFPGLSAGSRTWLESDPRRQTSGRNQKERRFRFMESIAGSSYDSVALLHRRTNCSEAISMPRVCNCLARRRRASGGMLGRRLAAIPAGKERFFQAETWFGATSVVQL